MTLNRKLFLYLFSAFFSLIAVITFFQYQREKNFERTLDQLLSTYNYTINNYIDKKAWTPNELGNLSPFSLILC